MLIQKFINSATQSDFNYDNYAKETMEPEYQVAIPPKTPVYHYETSSKGARVAWTIFSILLFPYGVYRLIQMFLARFVLPATSHSTVKKAYKFKEKGIENYTDFIQNERAKMVEIFKSKKLIAKRISIFVNGIKVDATLVGTAETLKRKRWMIHANGNLSHYETMGNEAMAKRIKKLDTNLLLFNYPGVAGSGSYATRDKMIATCEACFRLLEDPDKGLGAKEIIGWGASIGGGVMNQMALKHRFDPSIKYVFVKEQTFGKISDVPKYSWPGKILKYLAVALFYLFRWQFHTLKGSKRLDQLGIHEIVIQNGQSTTTKDATGKSAETPLPLRTPADVTGDLVIPAQSSLAYGLLKIKEAAQWTFKQFVPVLNEHCKEFISDKAVRVHVQAALENKE